MLKRKKANDNDRKVKVFRILVYELTMCVPSMKRANIDAISPLSTKTNFQPTINEIEFFFVIVKWTVQTKRSEKLHTIDRVSEKIKVIYNFRNVELHCHVKRVPTVVHKQKKNGHGFFAIIIKRSPTDQTSLGSNYRETLLFPTLFFRYEFSKREPDSTGESWEHKCLL